jgi:hypothetical protein
MSMNVKKHYLISLNNEKSVIFIELINATDDYSSSSMIIIQRQKIMIS